MELNSTCISRGFRAVTRLLCGGNDSHRWCFVVFVWLLVGNNTNAQNEANPVEFDWRSYRRSAVDLRLPPDIAFEHRKSNLTDDETESYLDLLDAVDVRRQNHWSADPDRAQGEWQRAFYDFTSARRKAWLSGNLRLVQRLEDPFRTADEQTTESEPTSTRRGSYTVLDDIRSHPDHYVGHPVVMYGLFEPAETTELLPKVEFRSGLIPQPVQLARGILKSRVDGQSLAVVDTRDLLTAERGRIGFEQWPTDKSLPVLVKGWFVKLWGKYPLIYCESLRLITENPHRDLITEYTIPDQKLLPDEAWLYYETLAQMEQSGRAQQERTAAAVLRERVDLLRQEIVDKSADDLTEVDTRLAGGSITSEEADRLRTRISRMLSQRLARHKKYIENPDSFETFRRFVSVSGRLAGATDQSSWSRSACRQLSGR